MKEILLSQGKITIVDDEDYEWLMQWKWSYDCGYATRKKWNPDTKKFTNIKMHRLIMKTPIDMFTDHINGEPLDNRKENLRICTQAENNRNRKAVKNHEYAGISYEKRIKRWRARVRLNKKNINLGCFLTAAEAAHAYDNAARIVYGEFARINYRENANE